MNFVNLSSTMYLANSILLGQVGATCRAAKNFVSAMTPTLATLLGKAVLPQMVALGASAMSTTPPIPIFSGPVITSIKGAVNHHDGRQCGCVMWIMNVVSCLFWGGPLGHRLDCQKISSLKRSTCARAPALVLIHSAPERTWQNGEHDRWRQREHDKNHHGIEQLARWESFVSFLCM